MSKTATAVCRFALAALATGAAPAFAQSSTDAGAIIVRPAKVLAGGSPDAYERSATLPPAPPGPIESRLVPIPDGSNLRLPSEVRHGQPAPAFVPPPPEAAAIRPAAPESSDTRMAARGPAGEPAAPSGAAPIAVVAFASQSANLTDVMRAELDQVAKRISDKRLRRIELRSFATGGEPDSRKIALARALIVRSYLIDRGVKSRIEVGDFSGEGERVDILAPNT